MNDKEIAHKRNDLGRHASFPSRDKTWRPGRKEKGLGDPLFRDKVATNIDNIPENFAGMQHCRTCEGVSCGICGQCHDLDRRSWRTDPACQEAHHMTDTDTECRAWAYAYIFIKEAMIRKFDQVE